jgi:hypothetical protein
MRRRLEAQRANSGCGLREASYELKFELQVQVMRLISGAHNILDCQAYMPIHTTPNLTHVYSMVQNVQPLQTKRRSGS